MYQNAKNLTYEIWTGLKEKKCKDLGVTLSHRIKCPTIKKYKMKKIFTLLTIAMLASTTATYAQTNKINTSNSVMVYSEDEEALVYKNNSQTNGKEIIIESLPGFGFDPIPVEIGLNENGSYTFKKHPSLVLPEYYSVEITDSVTGARFDLKTADSYTFEVAKATPDRFALQMHKIKNGSIAMN